MIPRKTSNENVIKKFYEIKLFIDKKLGDRNAESGKHKYGGYKE